MSETDERGRIADLIDQNAELIGTFAADPVRAVHLTALLVREHMGQS